jgi:hypothetical protein
LASPHYVLFMSETKPQQPQANKTLPPLKSCIFLLQCKA